MTEEQVRTLAKVTGSPVVSLYVDVDGRRTPRVVEFRERLDRLVRRGVARAGELDPSGAAAAVEHLERIRARVAAGIDRSGARGLACFAWGDADPVVLELPRPVHDQIAIGDRPHLRQLEELVAHRERWMVVLVDRERARLFRYEPGTLTELPGLVDESSPRVDEGFWSGPRLERHSDTLAGRHVDRVAETVAAELRSDRELDRVVVGGATRSARELVDALAGDVADRVAAVVDLPLEADVARILSVLRELEETREATRTEAWCEEARDAVGTRSGVAGLPDVLDALWGRRVRVLALPADFQLRGVECGACGRLAERGDRCAACGEATVPLEDLGERALELALEQDAAVRFCPDDTGLREPVAELRY